MQGEKPALIQDGDTVRCTNRQSYRHGQVGRVVEVVEQGRFRRGPGGERVHVGGSPNCEGPSFAWVLYADGVRTPHALTNVVKLEGKP